MASSHLDHYSLECKKALSYRSSRYRHIYCDHLISLDTPLQSLQHTISDFIRDEVTRFNEFERLIGIETSGVPDNENYLKAKITRLQEYLIRVVTQNEEAQAPPATVFEERNWPPFFPLIHHDIAHDIPIHLQRVQYAALGTWLGIIACLLWNIIAVTTAWINGDGYVGNFEADLQ